MTYGSYGNGSQPHLLYETIKAREHIDLLHVPYKGITPKLTALAGGEVMLGSGSVAVAAPLIAAGRIKPISVAGTRGGAQYPNVPTTVEQGYAYAQVSIWYALFAPAGTPAPIVERIGSDVQAILADPAFAQTNAVSKGLTVVAGDRAQLERTIQDETRVTAEQVKAAGVTPEWTDQCVVDACSGARRWRWLAWPGSGAPPPQQMESPCSRPCRHLLKSPSCACSASARMPRW